MKNAVKLRRKDLLQCLDFAGSCHHSFWHGTRMVVGNLPFPIFLHIHKRIPGLHLAAICTHGEFIYTSIFCPVRTRDGLALCDHTLGLVLQEIDKVISNSFWVFARSVTHSRKQNGILGISSSNLGRIFCGKGIIPQVEQATDFLVTQHFSLRSIHVFFWHDTGVMMSNLPLSIFKHIHICVPCQHLATIVTHSKFIHTGILCPSRA
mmetsp:Transcript_23404/g.43467  ORF Transcript_23404/g.43467 Transcript_23404/m.43467 type:complete len:207 (+) Transcript_23404:111-731(+)